MSSPSQIQRWSTEDVPPPIKFEYWANALSQALIPMGVASHAVGGFWAEQEATALGPLAVIWSRGAAHRSSRTRRELNRSLERSFHLLVSRQGAWFLDHRGRSRLERGDVILTDSRYEHLLEVPADYEMVNLKIPVSWLETWVVDPALLVGVRLAGVTPLGNALAAFVSQLLPGSLASAPLPGQVLADQVGTLLAMAAGEIVPANRPDDPRLLGRILDCLRDRCRESGLSAADVASSLGIETPVVHRSLASSGRSFMATLLETRATAAAPTVSKAGVSKASTARGRRQRP